MRHCPVCGKGTQPIAQVLGVCVDCIRAGRVEALERAAEVHAVGRERFGLPPTPPRDQSGITCRICANACRVGPGQLGYCGARRNRGGGWQGGGAGRAAVSFYRDPLPTNCVADWVCPASTSAGLGRFTDTMGPEVGYTNLAVFYEACTFDCLFCQNWHFRGVVGADVVGRTVEELAAAADGRVRCVCFFGGDPVAQLPHALAVARRLRRLGRSFLRICWETNGAMHPRLLDEMVKVSLESGGCVKFDLKAWDENLHQALCGVSNRRTLENVRRIGARIGERPDPPLFVASTLLVPGYVDREEVARLASFLVEIDPNIPYALLAFHPTFLMSDLPTTSRSHAERCLEAARAAGLKNVRIGNTHLLGPDYQTG